MSRLGAGIGYRGQQDGRCGRFSGLPLPAYRTRTVATL